MMVFIALAIVIGAVLVVYEIGRRRYERRFEAFLEELRTRNGGR
ncbi:MAG: hypothetical protein ACREI2_14805 [Nitrospiraceae bacterium]